MNKSDTIEYLEKLKKQYEEELQKIMSDLFQNNSIYFSDFNKLKDDLITNKIVLEPKNKKIKILRLISQIQGVEKGLRKNKDLSPEINDGLYDPILYPLRELYFNYFNTNPNIKVGNKSGGFLFYDSTLPIFVHQEYNITGYLNFTILFTGKITIKILDQDKVKLRNIDLKFIRELFNSYNSKINLILSSGNSFFLSDVEEHIYNKNQTRDFLYFDFFERLCDNKYWNIIYIDLSLKEGVSEKTLNLVDTSIVNKGIDVLASDRNISAEELKSQNNEFANYIINGINTSKTYKRNLV